MRSLITGDLHLSHNPRDSYRFDFINWFAELARKRKPDRIIIAGDLTEEKDRHPSILVNQVVEHVHTLAKIAPVVCLEGNHDYRDEGYAFFKFLSRIPNTRWVSKPTTLSDGWLLLPHTNDYKLAWGNIDLAKYRWIVCHQTFNGANVGFGRKLDGLPLKLLPRKSTTFCGDIHQPQEMEQLVYIGAPYHVDFGDNYASRVIECNDGQWVSVDTSTLPQKRAINLTAADKGLGDAITNKGDIVQITVELDDETWQKGWHRITDAIKAEAERRELRIWAIKPKLTKHMVRRRHKVKDTQNDSEVLETFAKRHGLTENTLAVGLKLLKS